MLESSSIPLNQSVSDTKYLTREIVVLFVLRGSNSTLTAGLVGNVRRFPDCEKTLTQEKLVRDTQSDNFQSATTFLHSVGILRDQCLEQNPL